MRIKTSERRICGGVRPLRPVSAFFKPRVRSQRTCSIMSFWVSRKSEMACSNLALLGAKKIKNALQHRLKAQALTHQLPIGKTDLPLRCPRHCSALVALRSSGARSLQRLDISRCRLVQQILQSAPVVQAALNLRHKLFRHVDGNTTPVRATVQDITLMLIARPTCRPMLADATATTQAQRTKNRRPKIRRFTPQPARDIRGRFRINMLHAKHVTLYTCTSQAKSCGKIPRNSLVSALKCISRQKRV